MHTIKDYSSIILENPGILTADTFSNIQLITSQSSLPDYDELSRDIHEVIHLT